MSIWSKSHQAKYQTQAQRVHYLTVSCSISHWHTCCYSLLSYSESWLYCLKIHCCCCFNVIWEDETCLWNILIIYIECFCWLSLPNTTWLYTQICMYCMCSNESKQVKYTQPVNILEKLLWMKKNSFIKIFFGLQQYFNIFNISSQILLRYIKNDDLLFYF